jgi:hypothetical protein
MSRQISDQVQLTQHQLQVSLNSALTAPSQSFSNSSSSSVCTRHNIRGRSQLEASATLKEHIKDSSVFDPWDQKSQKGQSSGAGKDCWL